eukprot:2679549-Rhodomonas_salina.2
MEKAELMREIEARDVALEQAHTELEELTSSQQKENKRVAKLRHELCETQVRAQHEQERLVSECAIHRDARAQKEAENSQLEQQASQLENAMASMRRELVSSTHVANEERERMEREREATRERLRRVKEDYQRQCRCCVFRTLTPQPLILAFRMHTSRRPTLEQMQLECDSRGPLADGRAQDASAQTLEAD